MFRSKIKWSLSKGDSTTMNLSKAQLFKNSRASLSRLLMLWSLGGLKIFPLGGRGTAWKMYSQMIVSY